MTFQVTLSIFELASAAGFACNIDPALVAAIGSMQTGNANSFSATLWSNGLVIKKRECSFISSCFLRQHVNWWGVQAVLFAAGLHRCVPAYPGPGSQLFLQPGAWRCIFMHSSPAATKCLTVIGLQTALDQILMTNSPVLTSCWQIVSKTDTLPWNTRLIRISVYHTFQSDWRGLQQSMLVNEKHVSVERLLFTDNFVWRASIQLLLACGPADPKCLALSLDCNI